MHGLKVLQGQTEGFTRKEGVLLKRLRHKGAGDDGNQTTTMNCTAGAKAYNSVEPFDDNITKMRVVRPDDHAPQKKNLALSAFVVSSCA